MQNLNSYWLYHDAIEHNLMVFKQSKLNGKLSVFMQRLMFSARVTAHNQSLGMDARNRRSVLFIRCNFNYSTQITHTRTLSMSRINRFHYVKK